MRIPQIQIQTTKAQLGINVSKPVQRIQQTQTDLHIRQPNAVVSMQTTDSTLRIDSSQARRDLGLFGPLESGRMNAQKGKQGVIAGIARRAQEGERMMRIENKGQPIQSIASTKVGRPMKSLGIKFVPSVNSVKISYTPSKLDINVQTHAPQINATVNKPINEYTPGKVSGYMMQYPSIEIDVIV